MLDVFDIFDLLHIDMKKKFRKFILKNTNGLKIRIEFNYHHGKLVSCEALAKIANCFTGSNTNSPGAICTYK